MGGFQVELPYLQGYADQFERNADGALAHITRHINEHCRNFDRIDGVLSPLRGIFSQGADNFAEGLGRTTETYRRNADELRGSAEVYAQTDSGAEKVFEKHGAQLMPSMGHAGRLPEPAVSMPESAVTPKAPPDNNEIDPFKEQIEGLIGDWVGTVKDFTGFDIMEQVMPFVLGDPGAIRRVGSAWGETGVALEALAENSRTGLDQVSGHWEGLAAHLAEQKIREKHIRSVTTQADICVALKDCCDGIARVYENALRAVISILRIRGLGIRKVVKEIKDLARNPAKLLSPDVLIELVETLWSLVTEIWDLIQEAIKSISDQCMMVWDMAKTLYHSLIVAVDLLELHTGGAAPLPELPK
ncbi:hypothetical protein [Saccharopolyspora taberi]|uniref:WXG100 family type VII secretion target n=1 Tax=Saccharopolyspora taberi TaxID=60895 RepID=A0ABN3V713_9PSEU